MIYFSSFWELQVGEILQLTQKGIEDMAQLLGWGLVEMDILGWMNRTIKLSKSLTTPEMHPKAPMDFFVCNSLSHQKSPSKSPPKKVCHKQIFLQKKSPSKIQPPLKKSPTGFHPDFANQILLWQSGATPTTEMPTKKRLRSKSPASCLYGR